MTTRESLQIVEIDINRCTLTYGAGACTASLSSSDVRKCYNTYFTCQDKSNFATSIETLRFARNQNGFKRSDRVYPALQSVSTNPIEINLGGVSDRKASLGKRARVKVSFKDFADSDVWFDRYQSQRVDGTAQNDEGGYNPLDRGTFFAKLRRRFPYYVGRSLRVKEGYVGDSLSSMRTRNYVITEWAGPDAAGNVTITASDVLDLADNKKAQAPKPSKGKLGANIAATGTPSFDLTPEDIGDEYPTSGSAAIGSEIVTFTRSNDTITLTGRSQGGSEASTHSIDDSFQLCYVVENGDIANVARDLLLNYADVDASYIPRSDWIAEASRWLSNYTINTIITKPTGVAKLLSELSKFGTMWWWDDESAKILMRANRPLDYDETAPDLSDNATFIEDKTGVTDLYDERLSRVLFYHGVIDYTGSVTSGDNFRRVSVAIDGEAESQLEYDQTQTHEVFTRWLGEAGSNTVATPVVARLLNRYRDTPREITFEYDVKDEADVQVASPVTVQSRLLQDDTGNSLPTEMQITSIEEVVPGHRLKAKAQSYQFSGRYGFITGNGRPTYSSSTDSQRSKGTYFVDETTLEFPDGTGPYLYF